MPGLLAVELDKKRKHAWKPEKPRKAVKLAGGEDIKIRILRYEQDSRSQDKQVDALEGLLSIIDDEQTTKIKVLAAVTLCRIFSRLIASEKLVKAGSLSDRELSTVLASRSALQAFTQLLRSWVGDDDAAKENAAVTLLMRILKEEVMQEPSRANQAWRGSSNFVKLVKTLITTPTAEGARQLFAEKYIEEHDDVRYHAFAAVQQVAKEGPAYALDLLAQIEGIPESQDQLEDWYGRPPTGKNAILSLSAHRKVAQEAWLAVFRSELTQDHRKRILTIMNAQILPWFATKLEILTDFLTDSFNASGSTAVLALGGLFHLMTQRNIDYPDFYIKLYSLLDEEILHSKRRNQFLRLLDSCLASTHLPAAMVASFIKRLARLGLQAPPGSIVWLIPWTYNLLRSHPTCTFMLHREEHRSHAIYTQHPNPAETGMNDPFNMTETDPMLTRAIDSSLWELETLQSHYHPNVATLSSILGEQFTKREYQLEDFLDHSYATLLDGELGRDLKKEPVVEWEIPKHIITAVEGDGKLSSLGVMLQQAVDVL